MKKILLSATLLMFGAAAFAQDLPQNPEPGKCYVRCKTPEVWKNEDVTIEVAPAYKKIVTHPAEYNTITERVLIKEAGQRLVVVPAVWENKTVSYTAKVDANKLSVVNATFNSDSQTIETKAASANWEMSEKAPDCESSDPNDCRYWCFVPVAAQYVTVPLTKLDKDATTVSNKVPGYDKTYTTKVMVTPPTTKSIEIPAEYGSINKTVLVKDAWQEEVTVDAKYKTVTKEILVNKGGLTTWKEVECELVNNTILPINWNLGSATLTSTAKGIIDTRLLPVLKTGVSVALESHTDSRGTKSSNQDLSERRAQAVTNYLISKGINPSKLTGNGYGEAKLTNRCADGVSCTEAQHRANRRTTFRVVNEK
ncbi:MULTISPECIES: OmpA family protein [unclassified Polaribacter]|jgi:outer membrane protein OmpA-like peptidoglycan-associated protein|uniref:OmpA family protein n=1 Tax=unclassified Polaribacter TaxID=196858 RepID=UPI001C4F90B9|nr:MULTISPECIES: OmpA family protein [unclassified Polaribacter]QXP64895.1 OmpA family protein [Polaribacter sp. HaHaR_3_91]QXP67390.1 OmpA family protein [Polaribacter sp. AHE13PA]QXP69543.1 OmpA family protein [Polaribacter sp. R2A056_3_33]